MRMKRRIKKRTVTINFKLSKKYKTLNQTQVNELIHHTQNLFDCLESVEGSLSKYKVFQSAISLITPLLLQEESQNDLLDE